MLGSAVTDCRTTAGKTAKYIFTTSTTITPTDNSFGHSFLLPEDIHQSLAAVGLTVLFILSLAFTTAKESLSFLINIPAPVYERKNELVMWGLGGRLKPAVDEKVQFALELLAGTQGNPIWFREE